MYPKRVFCITVACRWRRQRSRGVNTIGMLLLVSACISLQIIFSSKKRNCDKLAQGAWDRGFAVDSLHGDREQWERTKVSITQALL